MLIVTIGPLALFAWAAMRAKHRRLGARPPGREMFDPGAARAQVAIEGIAELPDPADSGDRGNDDDTRNTLAYKAVRPSVDTLPRLGGADVTRRRG